MVKSARVQEGVQGDDIEFIHQIVANKALLAELTKAPVTVDSGDVVRCFYPAADVTREEVGPFLGSPQGSLPSSIISVSIPKLSPGPEPLNDSRQIRAGQGQTVRVEITRVLDGSLETYYLHREFDMVERGFPEEPAPELNLT